MSPRLLKICLYGLDSTSFENLDCLRGHSQAYKNPQGRLHPPLVALINFDNSGYVHLRNSYLMVALHALIHKNAVEKLKNQTSLAFFNRFFLVLKLNNKWIPILDLSLLNTFMKSEKFKMETPESIKDPCKQANW